MISKENDLWLSLKDNGEFVVTKGENGEATTDLNQKDLFVYNMLCFLNLVRFWDEFNEIRDMNTEKLPVVIKIPDNCDWDLECFNENIKKMNREVIFFNNRSCLSDY